MPEGRRLAIGDIHGCFHTFHHLVQDVLQIHPQDTLFLLGDYIDRGPASKEVIDYILNLRDFCTVKPVMGNHEYMLLKSISDERFFKLWMLNSCETTLISFGVSPGKSMEWKSVNRIPLEYIDFFKGLNLYEETNDYLFVHAGIGSSAEDPLNNPDILLWTRTEDYNEPILQGRKMIHGHTPVELSLIRQRVLDPDSMIFNLDGGCVYSHFPGMGYLVALDLDKNRLYSVKNRG